MSYKAKSDDEGKEIHGLLGNITRLQKKPLKRWEKAVNRNHKKLYK